MSATSTATTYEIRLAGHLDDRWAATLGDLTLTRLEDGTTRLTGPVADQAQLHGLLSRIRDLGAPLLTLGTVDPAPGPGRRTLTSELTTERLTLRPGTPADAAATWAYRRLPSVGEWLTELAADLETYRSTFVDDARLATTVVVELDGVVIGDLMLRVEDAWAQAEVADAARGRQAELGWTLDPVHTGRGYATEAVGALLTHAFGELGVRRAFATCFLANTASWRLMERLGMRREGWSRAESLHRSGQWLDTVTYALLASERTTPDHDAHTPRHQPRREGAAP